MRLPTMSELCMTITDIKNECVTQTQKDAGVSLSLWSGVRSLLDIEIQMARELELSSEDLLVNAERIVIKEGRVPAEKNKMSSAAGLVDAAARG